MLLTSERLDLQAGESVASVAIMSSSRVAVLARGGLAALRHELEDVGFRDVEVYDAPPAGWPARETPSVTDLEWLVWWTGVARSDLSLRRDLTEDLRVVDAWTAVKNEAAPLPVPATYARACGRLLRFGGVLVAFGWAYAFRAREGEPC